MNDRRPTSEGRYANIVRVGFNAQEFLLDFGQLGQGDDEDDERYHTRIVVVPVNVKRFLAVLCKSVDDYEDTFAVIPDPEA